MSGAANQASSINRNLAGRQMWTHRFVSPVEPTVEYNVVAAPPGVSLARASRTHSAGLALKVGLSLSSFSRNAMMLALLLAASSSSPAVIQKIAVQVPGWPDLPYPFSEGILSCAACPDVPCTLKISGNQGYDHAAGHLVTGGIVNETAYALANIKSIAEAAGAKMDDLISCVVWLANITDFGAMNAVYTTFFTKPYPTRTTTAVALAGSAAVEITCEAVAPCPRPP